jgi:hypothetical protein
MLIQFPTPPGNNPPPRGDRKFTVVLWLAIVIGVMLLLMVTAK